MNEYLMLGIVGVVALTLGFGVSWLGKIFSSKPKTTDKT